MKLNKNEQNYLLTILFKSYILQSVICSGIILVCTVSLDMGLTWVLDRYVEHYYLIYRGHKRDNDTPLQPQSER